MLSSRPGLDRLVNDFVALDCCDPVDASRAIFGENTIIRMMPNARPSTKPRAPSTATCDSPWDSFRFERARARFVHRPSSRRSPSQLFNSGIA